MTPTRLAALAVLALLATTTVVAQRGPAPGYDDALVYAQDYAVNQTAQASADPAGYAGSKATQEGLENETAHTLYMACWAAWQETGESIDPVCAAYFTPPGEEDGVVEDEAEATAEVVDDQLNATEVLAAEALDAVNDTLADPTSAPEQVQRILDAVVGFASGLLKDVLAVVIVVVETVLGILGLGGLTMADGLGAVVDGLLAAVDALLDGLGLGVDGMQLLGSGLVDGVQATAQAVVGGLTAAASGIADAVTSAADAAQSGASASASGVSDVASSVASGVSDGVSATVQAAQDAARSVVDGVSSLFGGKSSGSSSSQRDGPQRPVDTGTEADSLVDRVLDLLS